MSIFNDSLLVKRWFLRPTPLVGLVVGATLLLVNLTSSVHLPLDVVIGAGLLIFLIIDWFFYAYEANNQKYALEVETSEKNLSLLLSSTAEGIFSLDVNGLCTVINASALDILGYDYDIELIGKPLHEIIHHHTMSGNPYIMEDCPTYKTLQTGKKTNVKHEVYWKKDGSMVHVQYSSYPITDNGVIRGVVVTFQDIGSQIHTENEIRKLSQATEQSANGIIITDASGLVEYINPKFSRITGYSSHDLYGKTPRLLKSDKLSDDFYQSLWDTIKSGKEWSGEFENRRKDGSLFWCTETIAPVRDTGGAITHFVGVMDDVSERKTSEEVIRRLVYFDPLTGLLNRRGFMEAIEAAKDWCSRHGGFIAICYLGLDRFKTINDSFGHSAGDTILQGVSKRLQDSIRNVDTVARMGGDEFAIIIRGIPHAETAAYMVERCLESLRSPIDIDGDDMYVNGSAGVSIYPLDSEDTGELLRMADSALYEAKAAGKNTYRFYSTSINTNAMERMKIEMALRTALANNEFHLEYQPKIDIKKNIVTGVEALLRWTSPSIGPIAPDRFIPVAEETRLIMKIGEWVVYEACHQMDTWRSQGLTDLSVSVNFSALQFKDKNLSHFIYEALSMYEIEPHRFEVEITESALMDSPEDAIATLNKIRNMGVHVSIDDFGTGYSSLMYLKSFPVNVLKIDRSFIRDITTDEADKTIANVIINFANSFHLKVVAEGVETKEQLDIMKHMGCDMIQGYYYSRPLLADKIIEFKNEFDVPHPQIH